MLLQSERRDRLCLGGCSQIFDSVGRGNRVCKACARRHAREPSPPKSHSVSGSSRSPMATDSQSVFLGSGASKAPSSVNGKTTKSKAPRKCKQPPVKRTRKARPLLQDTGALDF